MWCLLYVVFIALYYNSYCEHIRIDQARCRSAPRVFCENSFCSGEEKGGSPDPPPPPPPGPRGPGPHPCFALGFFLRRVPSPLSFTSLPPCKWRGRCRLLAGLSGPLWLPGCRVPASFLWSGCPPPPLGTPGEGQPAPFFSKPAQSSNFKEFLS